MPSSTKPNQIFNLTPATDLLSVELTYYLSVWIEGFLLDRRARGLVPGSIEFYSFNLGYFTRFCESQAIKEVTQITANDIRIFLLEHEEKGHNPGGIHAVYRCLKTFLRWFEVENELEGWKNPIRKVRAPRQPTDLLEPVSLETISVLLDTCQKDTFVGARDRAILLALFDTGTRASELLSILVEDINLATGSILIRQGKGRKPRYVYLERESRKALRAFLRFRGIKPGFLWLTNEGTCLTYGGLRAVLVERSNRAGIDQPALHDFRRAFAIACWRNGIDVITISRMLGHTTLVMTQRYIKQVDDDLRQAHVKASPVDRAGLGNRKYLPEKKGVPVRRKRKRSKKKD